MPLSPISSSSSLSSSSPSSLLCYAPSSAPLTKAIVQQDWSRALRLATGSSAHACCQQWSSHDGFFDGTLSARVLPLHVALVHMTTTTKSNAGNDDNNAPLEILHAIVQAHPQALAEAESSYERLPLHCACRFPHHHDTSTLQHLIQLYPQACAIPDALQRRPLHYALTNGASLDVIQALLDKCPEAAATVDVRGFSPLHAACAANADLSVIHCVWRACPDAAQRTSKSGLTVMQCLARHHPQREQVLQLLLRPPAPNDGDNDETREELETTTTTSVTAIEKEPPETTEPLLLLNRKGRCQDDNHTVDLVSMASSSSPTKHNRSPRHRRSLWGSWNRETFSSSRAASSSTRKTLVLV